MNEQDTDKFTIGYTNINAWYEPMGYLLADTNKARISAHIDPHRNTLLQYIATVSALSDNLLPYIKEAKHRGIIKNKEESVLTQVTFVGRSIGNNGEHLLRAVNEWYAELMEAAAKAQIFLKIKYIKREKSAYERAEQSFS